MSRAPRCADDPARRMGDAQAADAAACARDLRDAVEPEGGQAGAAEDEQQRRRGEPLRDLLLLLRVADLRAEALVDLGEVLGRRRLEEATAESSPRWPPASRCPAGRRASASGRCSGPARRPCRPACRARWCRRACRPRPPATRRRGARWSRSSWRRRTAARSRRAGAAPDRRRRGGDGAGDAEGAGVAVSGRGRAGVGGRLERHDDRVAERGPAVGLEVLEAPAGPAARSVVGATTSRASVEKATRPDAEAGGQLLDERLGGLLGGVEARRG